MPITGSAHRYTKTIWSWQARGQLQYQSDDRFNGDVYDRVLLNHFRSED